jgi:hypothetical protein
VFFYANKEFLLECSSSHKKFRVWPRPVYLIFLLSICDDKKFHHDVWLVEPAQSDPTRMARFWESGTARSGTLHELGKGTGLTRLVVGLGVATATDLLSLHDVHLNGETICCCATRHFLFYINIKRC